MNTPILFVAQTPRCGIRTQSFDLFVAFKDWIKGVIDTGDFHAAVATHAPEQLEGFARFVELCLGVSH